ncbi:MAG: FABP family protein, partial [Marmoricola sp.]
MSFEIPANIHPDCARLAWLIGTWAGNGHGEYPMIEPFQFGQELIFQQDGRPFIHYLSRSWITDAEGAVLREAAQETGFLRPQPDGTLEWVLTHNTGFVEIYYGELHPEQPRFAVVTDAVARTATAKEYAGGKRLYGYVDGDLLYAFDMAAM